LREPIGFLVERPGLGKPEYKSGQTESRCYELDPEIKQTKHSLQGIHRGVKSERCGDGRLAVLADHSTEGHYGGREGGEVNPGDPLKGRRSRASRNAGGNYGRYTGITNHINATSAHCAKLREAKWCAKRVSTVWFVVARVTGN